jgi:hypothetical protein
LRREVAVDSVEGVEEEVDAVEGRREVVRRVKVDRLRRNLRGARWMAGYIDD